MSGGAAPAFGLTTRWSLAGLDPGVSDALRAYVLGTSAARFTGRPGLLQKHWFIVDGESFGGTYLFASPAARSEFRTALAAAPSPVDAIVGAPPELVQDFEVVALVPGGEPLFPDPS